MHRSAMSRREVLFGAGALRVGICSTLRVIAAASQLLARHGREGCLAIVVNRVVAVQVLEIRFRVFAYRLHERAVIRERLNRFLIEVKHVGEVVGKLIALTEGT